MAYSSAQTLIRWSGALATYGLPATKGSESKTRRAL